MTKREGSGLGFSVAGGTDVEPKSIVVSDNVKMCSGTSLLKLPQNLSGQNSCQEFKGYWCLFAATKTNMEKWDVVFSLTTYTF